MTEACIWWQWDRKWQGWHHGLELIMQPWIFQALTCPNPWNESKPPVRMSSLLLALHGSQIWGVERGDQANTCYCYQPLHITHHPITLPNLEAAHEANTRSNFNSESGQDWLLDLGFAGTDQRYSCTVKKNIHNMVKMIRSCAYIPRAIAIGSAQFYTYFSCDANLVR